jgi:hypothetical protein
MYVVTYGVAVRFSIGNVRQPANPFEEKSRRMPSFAFSRGVPFSPRWQWHRQRRRENDEGSMAAVAPAAGETAHRRAPPGAGPAVSGLIPGRPDSGSDSVGLLVQLRAERLRVGSAPSAPPFSRRRGLSARPEREPLLGRCGAEATPTTNRRRDRSGSRLSQRVVPELLRGDGGTPRKASHAL